MHICIFILRVLEYIYPDWYFLIHWYFQINYISDNNYEKFTFNYGDDYDSSYGDLVENKDKKHFPARRKDVSFEKKRRKKEFWLDKQIKKLSHHTNDIKLKSSTHNIPGRHG